MELIRTAAADPQGNFCLILEFPGTAPDTPSVIIEFQRDRSEPWRRYKTSLDLIAVCRVPQNASGGAGFIAMSGSGDVIEISDVLTQERIQGAGYSDPDSNNLGRMTRLQVFDNKNLALGFGGQAYLRVGSRIWAPFATPFPKPVATTDTYKLIAADVVSDINAVAFAGCLVTGLEESEAIEAANFANDADLLVELMLQEVRPDSGVVLLFRHGSWSEVNVPFSGLVDGLVSDQSGSTFLWVRDGQIYGTRNFADLVEVANEDGVTGFSSLNTFDGKAVAATETNILWLDLTGTTIFSPAPPNSNGNVVDLSGEGRRLFLFRSASILCFSDGMWVEIVPPEEIANLG